MAESGEGDSRAEVVGVIGAGVMGSGIAQTLASAGYETICFDISADALAAARESVQSGHYGLARAVDLGKLSREDADASFARLEFTDDPIELKRLRSIVEHQDNPPHGESCS